MQTTEVVASRKGKKTGAFEIPPLHYVEGRRSEIGFLYVYSLCVHILNPCILVILDIDCEEISIIFHNKERGQMLHAWLV